MVRKRMVSLGNADLGISPATQFPAHHEGNDSSQVALIGQNLQIKHQLGVLFKRTRDPHGLLHQRQLPGVLFLSLLDTPLDIANRLEVLGNLSTVARSDSSLETRDPFG